MWRIVILVLLLLVMPSPVEGFADPFAADELPAGYITVMDENGQIILQTGRIVHVGDEFLNENNVLYQITAVEGLLARARYAGTESLAHFLPETLPVQAEAKDVPPPLIGIYHTHTDECYTPSDGRSTLAGKGTIMKVGSALADRLQANGYRVEHSVTLHDPHDANAYHRSRRTFVKLLTKQPVALFDIHRDSAPLAMYQTNINGQYAARILLVVGRQNQNRATTLNYAKIIKAATDSKYRGLVRGIFIARGNYNQDLSPRAMLVEIGTQYGPREAAEYSATLFADIVPAVLTASAGRVARAAPPAESETPTALPAAGGWGRDLLLMAGVLTIGSAAYLLLSTGSPREAKSKLYHFLTREFRDLFRSRRKGRS